MVNKLDSNEAYLKLSRGDIHSLCDLVPAWLKHVQAVTCGPLAHSAHVEIILSSASGMNPSGFGKCSLSHTSL